MSKLPNETYIRIHKALEELMKPIFDCLFAHLKSHLTFARELEKQLKFLEDAKGS